MRHILQAGLVTVAIALGMAAAQGCAHADPYWRCIEAGGTPDQCEGYINSYPLQQTPGYDDGSGRIPCTGDYASRTSPYCSGPNGSF